MENAFYIGKHMGCGCVSAVCVDDPKDKPFTARFVAELVRDGLIAERVSSLDGIVFKRCKHRIPKKAAL